MLGVDSAPWLAALASAGGGLHMWAVLLLIAGAVFAYAYDKIPLELTSLVILSLLMGMFHFFPLVNTEGIELLSSETLLLGFANPALITVLCLLVIGQAVVRTGALNDVANLILRMSRDKAPVALTITFITVTIISAILNNTPVVVIFIPIMSTLAKRLNISVSSVMIPLSFAAILGGMTTLIGSSTNLLVSGALIDLGFHELGFFDFLLPGLLLAGIGLVYNLLIAPRILPDRASLARNLIGTDERQFIAQIDVEYSSHLCGVQIEGSALSGVKDITVKMVQRGEHAYLPPFDSQFTVKAGDVLIISTTRAAISELLSDKPGTLLHKFPEMTEDEAATEEDVKPAEDIGLAEIVVAPASRMIGHTLEQIGFRYNYHCIVIGIQRGTRTIRSRLTEVRLAAGDVLLVLGNQEDLLALRENRDVLLLEWSTEELPARAYARRANSIFFSVVALAALDIIPIYISAFIGATAIILSGCLNLRQAIRALDQQIILMVAAALAMSASLQATGGASFLAEGMIEAMHGAPPLYIMSALFLLMALITNVLSNNASALLFTPIAVNTALMLEVDPMPFIFAVIFACNCSFATPVGYQTNLLVLGPGHYKFQDFLRAGIPLVLLVWIAYTIYSALNYELM